jgi:hypothetical protein
MTLSYRSWYAYMNSPESDIAGLLESYGPSIMTKVLTPGTLVAAR